MNVFNFLHTTFDGEGKADRVIQLGFNLDKVTSYGINEDGTATILLDDWHDEYIDEEVKSSKGNPKGTRTVKRAVNSHITLSVEETKRWMSLMIRSEQSSPFTYIAGVDPYRVEEKEVENS